MLTLSEVLTQIGIDIGIGAACRRVVRLQEEGCVLRALESVTGKRATPEEADRRFRQIDRQPDLIDTLIKQMTSDPKETGIRLAHAIKAEHRRVFSFVGQIAGSGSPMGRVLAGYEMTTARLTPEQIRQQIEAGRKVLIMGQVNDRGGFQGHAAHLGRTGDRLLSLSDGGTEVRLPERSKNSVILFQKK